MAAWSGLTAAVKASRRWGPRSATVKVAPASWAGASGPARACLGEAGRLGGDLGEALAVGVEDGRKRSDECHADVDA